MILYELLVHCSLINNQIINGHILKLEKPEQNMEKKKFTQTTMWKYSLTNMEQ